MSTENKIYPQNCPICGVGTNYVYAIRSAKSEAVSTWYRCTCGVIFKSTLPSRDCYNKKYLEYYEDKDNLPRIIHPAKVYASVIEELTYGRMMLDVGCGTTGLMDYMGERGWLSWGIDSNKAVVDGRNIYRADFETYDFSPNIDMDKAKDEVGDVELELKYDLLWFSEVLQSFTDPIGALKKASGLLREGGVIYISTPDIDFINKTGVAAFPHWNYKENYIMWSSSALKREVEKLGYEVIMCCRNVNARSLSNYNINMIIQKKYF